MSGLEIVGLVAAVLSAIRILPEIPKVWRRIIPGQKREETMKIRRQHAVATQRGGSEIAHRDTHLQWQQNQMAAQKNINQLSALQSHHAVQMHNNQTAVQWNTNQLHAIMSENTVRAYEVSLTSIIDTVNIGYRQHESQRMLLICCMVLIACLVYLLGIAVGENNFLKMLLQSRLDMEAPVKQSLSDFEIRDRRDDTQSIENLEHTSVPGGFHHVAWLVFLMVTGCQLLMFKGRT